MTDLTQRPLPLFYQDPQPLNALTHGALRLKDGDYGFAAQTNAAPLTLVEFASAARGYPVVFSQGETPFPMAILGLGAGNRFVADGRWAEGVCAPAYVRRYPFVFIEAGGDNLVLGIDMASERVVVSGEGGAALFEDGKPSALTEGAMAFCREFHAQHLQARAFGAALVEHDLLIAQQADARPAGGQPLSLGGFQVVDQARFAALPDAVVLDWHRKGWLALVHFHLASLERFVDLLAREQTPAAVIAPSKVSVEV
ncbi:SapC family protein [Caulobacter soli]|uniref:SapC family protein n=1 Tax=Caulobacter soli TaxID=2708539 RepID=UPI0013EA86EE|nr:SapC family protein [Caulobacter soli]